MAGRGPQPKDPANRARRNATLPMHTIISDPVPQPPLPPTMPDGVDWPEVTREWWAMWGRDPLTDEFRPTDWSDLLDTALIHARYWQGETKLAGELRLRVAKHGATQEDRARLRIQFAAADAADQRRENATQASSARARRGPLRAV